MRVSPRSSAVAAAALLALALIALPACTKARPPAATEIRVAAAADLAFAFEEVGKAYTARTGTRVIFSFGSTGLLAKQIREGAPFDLFAAANVSFIDEVIEAGRCRPETKASYARGRIVAWWRSDLASPPTSLADLADPRFVKIAIANPEHAPYGRAAREALISAGVWAAVEPKLVFGENVQQALKFATTGNADVAVVALSLAIVTEGGARLEIDTSQHKPLDQALVACGAHADGGAAFAAFVNGDEGRAIMRRFGFLLPGETGAPR